MASLVNARAVVTTTGHLTEPVWEDTGAVALVPAFDTEWFVAVARGLSPKATIGRRSPHAASDLSRALCARPYDSRTSRSGRRHGRMKGGGGGEGVGGGGEGEGGRGGEGRRGGGEGRGGGGGGVEGGGGMRGGGGGERGRGGGGGGGGDGGGQCGVGGVKEGRKRTRRPPEPRTVNRLVTISHSYVVANNRRLAHEMAVQGRGRWEVTAIAPARLAGDLRTSPLKPIDGEACTTHGLRVRLGRIPHLRRYERQLRTLLAGPWDVVHIWEEPYMAACAQVAAAAPKDARVVPCDVSEHRQVVSAAARLLRAKRDAPGGGLDCLWRDGARGAGRGASYAGEPVAGIPPGVDVIRFPPGPAVRAAVRSRSDGATTRRSWGFWDGSCRRRACAC